MSILSQNAERRKSVVAPPNLTLIFQGLLERYVRKLNIRGTRATGCCPLHDDQRPSFNGNLERCVWYCHGCGRGGGVRDFALALGEPWTSTRSESRTAHARRARLQAERLSRAILEQRAEERDLALCFKHRDVFGAAISCADLLGVFFRRPDLAEEFSDVLGETERAYGNALFSLTRVEAQLDGEVR